MKNKTETLTSRERVNRAIRHQPVDRMPIDLGIHFSTGISAFAYWNLREYLGMPTDNISIPDMTQFLARVDEDILERFHCDCMLLHPGWVSENRWNPRGKYEFSIPGSVNPVKQADGSWIMERGGHRLRMPSGGYFFDGGWPNYDERSSEEKLKALTKEAERIYKDTDYFTMHIGSFGGYFSLDADWLCKMITDPDEVIEGLERTHKHQIEYAGKLIDTMGGYIQAIEINSDLGSQKGPFCRPSLYEEICAPFLKKLCDFIHQNSDLKIFLHCCGSVKPLIPTLIDCGIDILNPVQISAENMDPNQLKQEFGDRMTFWGGGCNTQNVLNLGTPEDVKANVRQLVKCFKPGGGFVFNQVHNVMGDVKPENIIAMLDTAYEESFYE